MGHHAEDISSLIAYSRYVASRAVGIGFVGDIPVSIAIAEDDLPVLLESSERLVVTGVVTVSMRDGNRENLAFGDEIGERGFEVIDL